MPDVDEAFQAFEHAVEGVLSFVKGASYGLRLAEKRVGEASTRARPSGELERLVVALKLGPDCLSEVVVLALGDHFRMFLARALGLPEEPALPATVPETESLAGAPGALTTASRPLSLLLLLYRAALRGGTLDREVLLTQGLSQLEVLYPDGKVKLFRPGDRVTLSEQHLDDLGRALLEAAAAIKLRLVTAAGGEVQILTTPQGPEGDTPRP